jgi:hypothetical protein
MSAGGAGNDATQRPVKLAACSRALRITKVVGRTGLGGKLLRRLQDEKPGLHEGEKAGNLAGLKLRLR